MKLLEAISTDQCGVYTCKTILLDGCRYNCMRNVYVLGNVVAARVSRRLGCRIALTVLRSMLMCISFCHMLAGVESGVC